MALFRKNNGQLKRSIDIRINTPWVDFGFSQSRTGPEYKHKRSSKVKGPVHRVREIYREYIREYVLDDRRLEEYSETYMAGYSNLSDDEYAYGLETRQTSTFESSSDSDDFHLSIVFRRQGIEVEEFRFSKKF